MIRLAVILSAFLLVGCSKVPDRQVSSDHPQLTRGNGRLYFGSQPYSGHVVSYYQDSTLITSTPYYHGEVHGVKTAYYQNGSVKYLRNYESGEKDGVHYGYYPDGSKKFEYRFVNGANEGTHREWYASGQLAKLTNYKDGKPFGEQKVWRPDGKLRSNYVVQEDGRRYGLVGIKRCKNIDTEEEKIEPLTASVYEN